MIDSIFQPDQGANDKVDANSWLTAAWNEVPSKGKKHKKKNKKARKKAAKQTRKSMAVQQLAAVNYRCGYLAAENDMLKRMIALSVGAQRNRLDTTLLDGGLAILPSGQKI